MGDETIVARVPHDNTRVARPSEGPARAGIQIEIKLFHQRVEYVRWCFPTISAHLWYLFDSLPAAASGNPFVHGSPAASNAAKSSGL